MSFIAGYLMGLEDHKNEPKKIEANGEYEPDEGVRWDKVTVAVPIKGLNVSQNGTYRAADFGAAGFDPVNINVPDYKDEMERYRKLWLKEIGKGEPVETDIPKPWDPDDPDNPYDPDNSGDGGNYTFDNAVDVGSPDELDKYISIFKDADDIDIVEINEGLAIHIGKIYTGNRIDMQLTVTNLKNGMSTFGNSCHYNSLDIRHNGCEYMGIAIHNGMVSAYYKSGYAFILDTWLSTIDFHAPDNWDRHYILV